MAKKTNNAVLVQVKGNQKFLLAVCEKVACSSTPTYTSVSRVKRGGRLEKRVTRVFTNIERFFSETMWNEWGMHIDSIITVTRERKIFNPTKKQWHVATECAYHISTTTLSARLFANIIRRHWWIENKNHYVRDVSMNEDASRIRVNPDRFAILRSFALNILRVNHVSNVKLTLFENGLDLKSVLNYKNLC